MKVPVVARRDVVKFVDVIVSEKLWQYALPFFGVEECRMSFAYDPAMHLFCREIACIALVPWFVDTGL